jgi:methylaspartate mutase epsilon subunit
MGPFPHEPAQAQALIALGGLVGRVGGASKIVTKTHVEASGIPNADDNARGLRLTRSAAGKMYDGLMPDAETVNAERALLEAEVAELLDPVVGAKDLDAAILAAFASGSLDIPFSPNRGIPSRVIPGRDADGAVRFVDAGNLSLSSATRARHAALMSQAAEPEQRLQDILAAIQYFQDTKARSPEVNSRSC